MSEVKLIPIPKSGICKLSELHLIDEPTIQEFFLGSARRVKYFKYDYDLPTFKKSPAKHGNLFCDINKIKLWIEAIINPSDSIQPD